MTEGKKTTTRPRRRRWAWIPLGFLLLVVVCLALPFVLVRFEGPRNWMLDRGPGEWLLDEGTRLRVERVERIQDDWGPRSLTDHYADWRAEDADWGDGEDEHEDYY